MKVCDGCGKPSIEVEDCGSNDFQVTTELLHLEELDSEGGRSELMLKSADLCPDCHDALLGSLEKIWSELLSNS